jgi:hypothetical protein
MVETPSSNFEFPADLPLTPTPGVTPVKLPLILVLIAVTMFAPEEVSFFFGERRMTVTRLLFLLLAPAILFRFAQLIVKKEYRFVLSDALVPITGLWMFVGPIAIDGFDQAIVSTGVSALEFCLPYLAARLYLSERGQALALVRILCIAIATVGLLAIFDEISRRWLVRETVGHLTGYDHSDLDVSDEALGNVRGLLFRATSTLEHPILLGTTCLFGLLLASTLRGGARQYAFVGSALGMVLAASSAPVLGALIGFATLLYEKFTRPFAFRWTAAFACIVVLLMILFISHHDPLGFLINHLTFDPGSAWYRVLQWDCAGGLVLKSPILGIGLSDEWVSICGLANTIDSVWLRTAMMYGIPGSLLVFLCYVGGSSLPVGIEDESLNLTRRERQLGFILSVLLGVAIFIGITVFYWGTVYILTMFLTGIRAHLGALGAEPRDPWIDDDA